MQHPLEHGQTFRSPGCHFTYRVIGPCCRLFDREELPWPCCRLQWRGKEPSWRRIGKRFVPDLATKGSPSYSVEVVGQEYAGRTFVVTLYAVKLPQSLREWWHSKKAQPEQLPPKDGAQPGEMALGCSAPGCSAPAGQPSAQATAQITTQLKPSRSTLQANSRPFLGAAIN